MQLWSSREIVLTFSTTLAFLVAKKDKGKVNNTMHVHMKSTHNNILLNLLQITIMKYQFIFNIKALENISLIFFKPG